MKLLACDKCQSTKDVNVMFIVTGRETDAAGSRDDVGENVDLCSRCAVRLVCRLLGERNYVLNAGILSWVRKGK